LNLASIVASKALKGESLGIYPTPTAQEEAKDDFEWNLYNCLNWLLRAFEAGTGESIDRFKENLMEHPLELYVKALNIIKDEVEKNLDGNRDVINTIHRYIDILISEIKK
jgi:hypothetical protein